MLLPFHVLPADSADPEKKEKINENTAAYRVTATYSVT